MAFTDNFTEASDTALESHTPSGGTAWTRVDGAASGIIVESSTGAARAASTTNTLYWCDDQGSADQYVQFTKGVTADGNSFVCNRATDNQNFIGIRVVAGKVQVWRRNANNFGQIGTDGNLAVVTGDTIRLESNGDVHTAYVNGVADSNAGGTYSPFNTVTRQGLCTRSNLPDGSAWVDNFEAGALTPPGTEALTGSASTGGQTAPSLTTSVPL
jgi:hypothetical protein